MIKIQTSNQNLPHVIHYLQRLLSPPLLNLTRAVGACCTRARHWPIARCHVSLSQTIKQCWIHSTPLSSTSLFPHFQHTIGKVTSVESHFQHSHCTWSENDNNDKLKVDLKLNLKGNDICTTIFVQLSLSYSHYFLILSLPFSLSIVFDQWKERKQGCLKSCTKIVVQLNYYYYFFW